MKLELKDPSMPEGMLFHVNDLGTFENGKITDFTDEQVQLFEAAQGRSIQEAFANHASIRVVGESKKEVND